MSDRILVTKEKAVVTIDCLGDESLAETIQTQINKQVNARSVRYIRKLAERIGK